MRRLKWVVGAAIAGAACARMAPPPGGPVRLKPPVLVGTYPESVEVLPNFHGAAEFRFDEVISEGGQPNFGRGTGDLEKLVLLSPDTAVPSVAWHRDRITVRPHGGWKPNTVYRIELAPGIMDLHNNTSKSSSVITLSTGGALPTRYLSGRAVDWSARHPVPSALIEAFHLPDSSRYRTIADSTGRFRLGPLPDGPYLVAATIDQNHNAKRESNEAWDTVRVAASRDTVGEIWAFIRDTMPPRIQDITRQDSQSIAVTFTKPVDPSQRLDSTSIRVLLLIPPKDSATIGPVAAYPKATYDTVYPPAIVHTAKADSAARRDSLQRDSIARATPAPRHRRGEPPPPPVDSLFQKRPVLGSVLVIHTTGRVQLGKTYFVELKHVRMAGGTTGPAVARSFDTPKPPSAADSAKARADSAKADSVARAKVDSTHPPGNVLRASPAPAPPAKPVVPPSKPAIPPGKPDTTIRRPE